MRGKSNSIFAVSCSGTGGSKFAIGGSHETRANDVQAGNSPAMMDRTREFTELVLKSIQTHGLQNEATAPLRRKSLVKDIKDEYTLEAYRIVWSNIMALLTCVCSSATSFRYATFS